MTTSWRTSTRSEHPPLLNWVHSWGPDAHQSCAAAWNTHSTCSNRDAKESLETLCVCPRTTKKNLWTERWLKHKSELLISVEMVINAERLLEKVYLDGSWYCEMKKVEVEGKGEVNVALRLQKISSEKRDWARTGDRGRKLGLEKLREESWI